MPRPIPSSPLPPQIRRLFPHYAPADLTTTRAREFVALRVAEEGDRADLRWLVEALGEPRLRRILAARGARQLSGRSRAFWHLVLGQPEEESSAPGGDTWPQ